MASSFANADLLVELNADLRREIGANATRALPQPRQRFIRVLSQDGGDIVPYQLGAYRLEGGSHCFARARGGFATPTPEARDVDATTGVQTAVVFADALARRFGLEPEEVGGILRYHAGDGAAGRLAADRFGAVHDGTVSMGKAERQELAKAGDGAGLSASVPRSTPTDGAQPGGCLGS